MEVLELKVQEVDFIDGNSPDTIEVVDGMEVHIRVKGITPVQYRALSIGIFNLVASVQGIPE